MRPLFRLPGRAALDDLTSWLGSYSVGLYLTRKLCDQGRYNRREAFIIVTAFSTVSIGFVGVVASTLDLLDMFPLVFATYFVVVYLVAAILVRLWPTTSIPTTYLVEPDPEPEQSVTFFERWRLAWSEAKRRAREAPGPLEVAVVGFFDGLRLASTILGTILAVGTAALLLVEHTSLFTEMGRPLAPILSGLGLPDADQLAPAALAGITEMYIPALLVRDVAIEGRFFICVLSISQLIFFSSVAPMMMDMFRDVPIRFRQLVALFFIRTLILIPILAALCWLYGALGFF
jgi:nucleoside recognition membrane protein YjiH